MHIFYTKKFKKIKDYSMISHCCLTSQNVMTCHNKNLFICRGSCLCLLVCLSLCLSLCFSSCGFSTCSRDSLEPDSSTTGLLTQWLKAIVHVLYLEGSKFFTFYPPRFLTHPRKLCSIILTTFCSLQEIQGKGIRLCFLMGIPKRSVELFFLIRQW